jgi:GT2 family glycosyltransferase
MTGPEGAVDVAVAIVAYRVRGALARCLDSLDGALGDLSARVTVVDNSPDLATWHSLAARPRVRRLRGGPSLGFGAACNLALMQAEARYFLVLNPDTVLPPGGVQALAGELDRDPAIGIIGPKLVRENGELDPAARRSFPTPGVALARLTGIGRLFPGSRRLGGYNLTYLDPDHRAAVGAVSGAFMLTRGALFQDLGGFDRRFWMYGEDLDFAHRVGRRGQKVVYEPSVTVVHAKRRSSAQRPLRTRYEFYRAMLLFYRKHQGGERWFLMNGLVVAGIFALGVGSVLLEGLRRVIRAVRLRRDSADHRR